MQSERPWEIGHGLRNGEVPAILCRNGVGTVRPNFEGFAKSHESRHPGESLGPEVFVFPEFLLSHE